MPDCLRLGKDPYSKSSFEDMKLLLLLLLGCAVQCPNKESFIERIKTLPIESQHALVHYIKQVCTYLHHFIETIEYFVTKTVECFIYS